MEKRKPHYILAEIKNIVSVPTNPTALRGGLDLGLSEHEMRLVVLSLFRRDFYKSMTTTADHKIWQDVYHGMTKDGVAVYIKITTYANERPPVIQFKAK
ncbi:MAG: type II toxin-antitoxin system MqsR family toxin [Pseudomonadota bacterium]